MKAVNVGLLGLGTVGGGALAVLRRNADEISRRAGREIRVSAAAVRDLKKPRPGVDDIQLTGDAMQIVDDPDIDIVVELIGGDGIAKEAALRAIDNRKHIVTANKALIALHGNAIFERAQRAGVTVAFKPRSPAASRLSKPCARGWRRIASRPWPASSTAPATTS